jgi:RHS repeat-associated protein
MLRDIITDAKGSVVATSDASGLHARGYAPYGYAPKNAALSALGYNGEYTDPVTGDYHLGNGYRAFSPTVMRFTAPDSWAPFGSGGLNTYAYCSGNPINASDPSGHMAKWLDYTLMGLAIAGAAVGVFEGGMSFYLFAKGLKQGVSSGGEALEMGEMVTLPSRRALGGRTVGGLRDSGPVPHGGATDIARVEKQAVGPNSNGATRTSRLDGVVESHGRFSGPAEPTQNFMERASNAAWRRRIRGGPSGSVSSESSGSAESIGSSRGSSAASATTLSSRRSSAEYDSVYVMERGSPTVHPLPSGPPREWAPIPVRYLGRMNSDPTGNNDGPDFGFRTRGRTLSEGNPREDYRDMRRSSNVYRNAALIALLDIRAPDDLLERFAHSP